MVLHFICNQLSSSQNVYVAMDSVNSQSNVNTQELDSSELIISSGRPGMKREFKRMVESQSEMGGLLMGRRRVTRPQTVGSTSEDTVPSDDKSNKKVRRLGFEGTKKDGGKFTSGESMIAEVVRGSDNEGTSNCRPSNLETEESKKIESKIIPTKLMDLLGTGLLEGLDVFYLRGSKERQQPDLGLHGVIRGKGILCSCYECQGNKVITPSKFEIHARSKNKRPPEYIYLGNGNSLRYVLDQCKGQLSDSLLSVIQMAIGRTDYMDTFCLNCQGLIPEAGEGRPMLLCDACVSKQPDSHHTQTAHTTTRSPLVDSSSSVPSSGCLVLESDETSCRSQCQTKQQGKLTRRDMRMHKSVFSENVLPDGATLTYTKDNKIWLQGYKKDGGILCECCKQVVSPSVFEDHAGFGSRKRPYMNIFTSEGVSLHALSVQISKNKIFCADESDHYCSICNDGGDLLCCENCPRVFHLGCVDLSNIPSGTWYCRYCVRMLEKEKIAERKANAIAEGREPDVDPITEINPRGTLTLETVEAVFDECAFCRLDDFSTDGFNDRTIMICEQCEKECHVGCLREHKIADLKELPKEKWFCCKQCNNINSTLQKLMGDGEKRLPESILNIIKKKFEVHGLQQCPKLDIKWRVLNGKEASEEIKQTLLSAVVTIFHDQFDPIFDANNEFDLIPEVVFGRSFGRYDFGGMYCAILMVNSMVMSAGVFRIFGDKVAELPLAATKKYNEGKGYFQAFYYYLESILSSLNVREVVLPAERNAAAMWKKKFGFKKLKKEELDSYERKYPLLTFAQTIVLHKSIGSG